MDDLIKRVNNIVELCWESFCSKIGGGLIEVNKEASMQLNFAYLLKTTIDLTLYHQDEAVTIELETGIKVKERWRECDIVLEIKKAQQISYLPIEMKCYKTFASSGGKRGAVDIFYKDVYADLELLEAYAQVPNYTNGIQLTMTDFKNLPYPPKRVGKYLAYDISHGAVIENGIHLDVSIGGQPVNILLRGKYEFIWNQEGNYYFMKIQNNG